MGFGNAHVKEPSGGAELLGKAVQASAIPHSGGDGADAFVFRARQVSSCQTPRRSSPLPLERFPGFDPNLETPWKAPGLRSAGEYPCPWWSLNMYQHRHMKGFARSSTSQRLSTSWLLTGPRYT